MDHLVDPVPGKKGGDVPWSHVSVLVVHSAINVMLEFVWPALFRIIQSKKFCVRK